MVASLTSPKLTTSDYYPQLDSFYADDAVKQLLAPLLDCVVAVAEQSEPDRQVNQALRLAVGLSGGADSSMLLAVLAPVAKQLAIDLHILHIHHGLMADADAWAAHCQALASYFGFSCHVIAVKVSETKALGEEAAARLARYQAYSDYCQEHQIDNFILAHHLNDQAETLLLRLLRGAGVRGMSGMQLSHRYGGVTYYRPWLSVDRSVITRAASHFTQLSGFEMIKDPSNLDVRYKRAAVRRLLIPGLDQAWPQWKQTLNRHAALMTETQALLDEVAASDLETLDLRDEGRDFCLVRWRDLTPRRQVNVLRHWLSLHAIQMPTERRIQDWLRQLREVHQLGFDRALRLQHQDYVITVSRGRVQIKVE